MALNEREAVERESGGEHAVEWSVRPWRERPLRAALGVFTAIALCLVIVSQRIGSLPTFVLCVAAVAAFAPLFAPSRCRVDEQGAGRRGTLGWERRPWDAFRRARVGREALTLSPYRSPHWLDRYRSLVLPLPGKGSDGLRDELANVLERHGLRG
jgi:hypothetical protein